MQEIEKMNRPLSVEELGWLEKLVSMEFEGNDEIETQIPYCRVVGKYGDDAKSVLVTVDRSKCVGYSHDRRVPVRIEGISNEAPVTILLHQVDGYLAEIEVVDWQKRSLDTILDAATFEKC
jgi:hypothetical protein